VVLLVLILLPVVEVYVLIQVGQEIGFWLTLGVLILAAIVGTRLAAAQGMGAFRRVEAAVAEGRVPAHEMAEGVVVLVAGLLLVFPGLVSDVAALLLLLPPVRRALGGRMLARSRVGRPFVVRSRLIHTDRDPAPRPPPPEELEP
jgi:UPF0716 protein FxsA